MLCSRRNIGLGRLVTMPRLRYRKPLQPRRRRMRMRLKVRLIISLAGMGSRKIQKPAFGFYISLQRISLLRRECLSKDGNEVTWTMHWRCCPMMSGKWLFHGLRARLQQVVTRAVLFLEMMLTEKNNTALRQIIGESLGSPDCRQFPSAIRAALRRRSSRNPGSPSRQPGRRCPPRGRWSPSFPASSP